MRSLSVSRRSRPRSATGRAALLLLGLVLAACTPIGPKTVMRDRLDFGTVVAESWKQQTLLAIVKLRYLDVPVFLDVGQIVSGYTLETGVDVAGQLAPVNRGDTFGAIGGRGVFTDRPTITYTPLTGEQFLRGLIRPIPTVSILYTLQTGYAADFVLAWTLESLNGLHNRSTLPGSMRPADPDFVRALELMRDLQAAGGVSVGVEKAVGDETTVVVFRRADRDAPLREKGAELRRLLGLPAEELRFPVLTSPGRAPAGQLALQPRSLLQMLQAAATFVEVPPEHLAREWALPAPARGADDPVFGVSIRSSRQKPSNAYAAVRYKGYWFSIDQSDWRTKRTLGFAILLFTLTDSAGKADRLPVLTIPAGQ